MTGLSQIVTEEIRAEMARQRVNQRELAERLGWTQGYLSRRLTGDVPLSLDDADRITWNLGISLLEVQAKRVMSGGTSGE